MKSLYLKVTTIRHLNESDYQKYKKEVDSAGIKVDWDELEKYGLFVGFFLGMKRILRCHPWNQGGIDFP